MTAADDGRPARVAALHVHRDAVHVALETADGHTTVTIPVTAGMAHALGHLRAARTCRCGPATVDPARFGLLARILDVLDATRPVVVIRGGDRPAFWLRVEASGARHELDLDVIDAVTLLGAGGLPVRLVDTAAGDWDAAFRDLVAGRLAPPGSEQDDEPPR